MLHRWIRIALFNLLIVALLGVTLRFKIAFSLPFIDQRNLLSGHSHFAFAGWVTQALMTLMIADLENKKGIAEYKKYRPLLYANLITAYGMLISFPIEGYAFVSILFSTLSIFVSYFFAVRYWRDLNRLPVKAISYYWFKAAFIFSAFSSLGPFSLGYMMATHNLHQNWYLASVYYFLHFQYNGWFFFVCMGLIMEKMFMPIMKDKILHWIFWLFSLSCIPAYFLSALWLPIPGWLYVIIVLSAIAQIIGWVLSIRLIKQQISYVRSILNPTATTLITLSAIALSIKLILQLGSTIPSLSTLAYGFRPIIIGYLHLVFLGIITLFILGYIASEKSITLNKKTINAIWVFVIGVFFNELFLMIQGIADLSYTPVPYINEMLLLAALTLFSGMLLINIGQLNPKK